MKCKKGLWVDTIHNLVNETYYNNGLKSGIFNQYDLKGRLLVLGKCCKDKMCGTRRFFENNRIFAVCFKGFFY